MPAQDRITYAQKKLRDLLEKRMLRGWCLKNSLTPDSFFRVATGERNPSYAMMSAAANVIPPIEWLFYTDERMPYPPETVSKWNPKEKSSFILNHSAKYRLVAEKCGIDEHAAYRMFVSREILPTPPVIRACCAVANPTEFFVPAEVRDSESVMFVPGRGDIVLMQDSPSTLSFVLSSKEFSQRTSKAVVCPVEEFGDGLKLKGKAFSGVAVCDTIETIDLQAVSRLRFVESVSAKTAEKILAAAKKVFE